MKRLLAAGLALLVLAPGAAVSQQTPPATPAPAPAPAASRSQAIEGVAVLVNDEVISYTDVRRRAQLILLQYGGKPDEEILREAQSQAVESLIEEKVQLQEFKKLAKDAVISDQDIQQELTRLAARNKQTPDAFLNGLASRGVSVQTLKDQLKASIAWNELIRGRFARNVRVSDMRITDMMERAKGSLGKPRFRLAEIFLYAPDAGSRANAVARAAAFRKQIEQGAPFDAVAQQFSAAPSASAGGDLGWMSAADMRSEFLPAVEAATPPSFLPPIETDEGVYLIAYLGKREAADLNKAQLKLKQLSASGADAAIRLQKVKTAITTCPSVEAAAATVQGVTVTPLDSIELTAMSDQFRTALSPLNAGQSTGVLDLGESKTMLFVCERTLADGQMQTRDQIYDQLFQTEVAMQADRYLRDLKRDATIVRR